MRGRRWGVKIYQGHLSWLSTRAWYTHNVTGLRQSRACVTVKPYMPHWLSRRLHSSDSEGTMDLLLAKGAISTLTSLKVATSASTYHSLTKWSFCDVIVLMVIGHMLHRIGSSGKHRRNRGSESLRFWTFLVELVRCPSWPGVLSTHTWRRWGSNLMIDRS